MKPPAFHSTHPTEGMKPTGVRYVVLSLTFVTAMIMYIDRVCIGAAAPVIRAEFGFDRITMGYVFAAFSLGYAVFQVPGGWAADRFGPRRILALAVLWWSAFTAATAAASGAASMIAYRFLFGVGEASAFPSASRALVRWLPVSQRAFGQGFQHAGSRFGAAITPPLVITLIGITGWRGVFYLLGGIGIAWATIWYWYYRDCPEDHAGVNGMELRILSRSGFQGKRRAPGVVPWGTILRSWNLWALSLMYFCYGWVVWMYLAWLPTYLVEERGFTDLKMGLAASTPLLAATISNAMGGWVSDKLAHRWGDLRRGRLFVSCIGFAIGAVGLVPGALASSSAAALLWLTIALAGLELTVAVSWAICLDIGGEYSGSVSSVMNTCGNLGGALSGVVVGYLATWLAWTAPLLVSAGLCVAAALIATRIDPRRSAVAAV